MSAFTGNNNTELVGNNTSGFVGNINSDLVESKISGHGEPNISGHGEPNDSEHVESNNSQHVGYNPEHVEFSHETVQETSSMTIEEHLQTDVLDTELKTDVLETEPKPTVLNIGDRIDGTVCQIGYCSFIIVTKKGLIALQWYPPCAGTTEIPQLNKNIDINNLKISYITQLEFLNFVTDENTYQIGGKKFKGGSWSINNFIGIGGSKFPRLWLHDKVTLIIEGFGLLDRSGELIENTENNAFRCKIMGLEEYGILYATDKLMSQYAEDVIVFSMKKDKEGTYVRMLKRGNNSNIDAPNRWTLGGGEHRENNTAKYAEFLRCLSEELGLDVTREYDETKIYAFTNYATHDKDGRDSRYDVFDVLTHEGIKPLGELRYSCTRVNIVFVVGEIDESQIKHTDHHEITKGIWVPVNKFYEIFTDDKLAFISHKANFEIALRALAEFKDMTDEEKDAYLTFGKM